ncbi:MAG TPA: hypothetical protein VMU38_03595 [Candidatus Binatia bacterium]|nr:hypothetical protein [Candidatus Binatia bacterium]
MKLSALSASVLAVATLAALGGCGGSQSGNPNLAPQTAPAGKSAGRHVPAGNLLYVSDPGTSQVQVFNYPAGALYQTLTGFTQPAGECVDSTSHVYVTDTAANTIVEYAHGNSTPIATLADPGQLPVACAVKNSPQYTVAVANLASTSGPPGSISVYLNHATSPNFVYSNSTVFQTVNYLGYYQGNLYVDGLNPSSTFQFGKMNNSGTITAIAITGPGGSPALPGGVQHPPWPTTYIAVGDAAGSTIYHIKTNGVSILNTPNSPTVLTGTCNTILQFFLVKIAPQQHEVINPESCAGMVGVHKYPAGGPSGYNYTTSLVGPVGVVVSP